MVKSEAKYDSPNHYDVIGIDGLSERKWMPMGEVSRLAGPDVVIGFGARLFFGSLDEVWPLKQSSAVPEPNRAVFWRGTGLLTRDRG